MLNPFHENKKHKYERTGGNDNSKKVLQYSHDRYRRPCHFFDGPAPNFPSSPWRTPPSHVEYGRDHALTSHMEAKGLERCSNNPPAATRLKFGQSDVLTLHFPSRAVGALGMAQKSSLMSAGSDVSSKRHWWCYRGWIVPAKRKMFRIFPPGSSGVAMVLTGSCNHLADLGLPSILQINLFLKSETFQNWFLLCAASKPEVFNGLRHGIKRVLCPVRAVAIWEGSLERKDSTYTSHQERAREQLFRTEPLGERSRKSLGC